MTLVSSYLRPWDPSFGFSVAFRITTLTSQIHRRNIQEIPFSPKAYCPQPLRIRPPLHNQLGVGLKGVIGFLGTSTTHSIKQPPLFYLFQCFVFVPASRVLIHNRRTTGGLLLQTRILRSSYHHRRYQPRLDFLVKGVKATGCCGVAARPHRKHHPAPCQPHKRSPQVHHSSKVTYWLQSLIYRSS